VVVLAQESLPHGGAQYCRAALWGWCWRYHVKGGHKAAVRPAERSEARLAESQAGLEAHLP